MSITSLTDLNQLIRAKLDSSELAEPRAVADALVDDGDIDPEDFETVLRVTLPHFVRECERNRRPSSEDHSVHDDQTTNVSGRRRRSGRDNHSSRWTSADVYGLRYFTRATEPDGEWKLLGDLTWADVQSVADEYGRRASENGHKQDLWLRIVSLRERYPETETLRGVPADVLEEILTS